MEGEKNYIEQTNQGSHNQRKITQNLLSIFSSLDVKRNFHTDGAAALKPNLSRLVDERHLPEWVFLSCQQHSFRMES